MKKLLAMLLVCAMLFSLTACGKKSDGEDDGLDLIGFCSVSLSESIYVLTQKALEDIFPAAYPVTCMHEFVISLDELHKETGVSALDMAKGLLDYGIHPPTMYFPLIVHEALMIEPTETETKETMDEAIEAIRTLYNKAHEDAESLHRTPLKAAIGRPDEVEAARHPKLIYQKEQ